MTKKSLGYVNLEWTCPFCGTRNPGPNKKCSNCGSPQPEDVQFEQAAQETFIEDEKLIEKAKAGPDIHCPYCGTRNPAGATTCSNCMGDLTDAAVREHGEVLGQHRQEAQPDVACPYCGTMNPATAVKCANCQANLQKPQSPPATAAKPAARPKRRGMSVIGIVAIVALIALCIFLASLFFRTDDVIGRVASVEWTRTIAIEGLVPVEHSDFLEDIPQDAAVGDCHQELHHVQDSPAPNSQEVCGTPYTVDTGTGVGEVVQDCQYEVYADYCSYTVDEWQQVDVATMTGTDFTPLWPQPQLAGNQRLGEQDEQYEVIFQGDGKQYTYTTSSLDRFTQFTVGSE
ncbi:MAG: zinc ribbon domain-containing protein, partial [Anaerolineae bacterium]